MENLPVRGCAVNGGHGLRVRVAFGLPSLNRNGANKLSAKALFVVVLLGTLMPGPLCSSIWSFVELYEKPTRGQIEK